MSKFIIVLVILVVLAGTVFYFGWIQIHLPENTYAVIFTKTGGWDDTVIKPGTFVWRWERLLPTNCKIHMFTIKPYTANISASGSLPSGNVYAGMLDPQPQFDFSVSMTVSFNVDPESLPHLVSTAALTEDTFAQWQDEAKSAIAAKAEAFVRERSTDVNAATTLTSMGNAIVEDLRRYLENSFADLDFKAIVVNDIEVPDFELYLTAKQLFLQYSKSRELSREQALSQITWTEARSQQYFGVLEKYGELLAKYPSLLDLLSLKGGNLGTILEEIDAFSPPPESP